MAKPHGSVRIGPISLFTLIITLCLAVMSVLTVTTAQASYSLTARQADAVTMLYRDERAAQLFVSNIDEALMVGTKDKSFSTADFEAGLDDIVTATVKELGDEAPAIEADWLSAYDACAAAGVDMVGVEKPLVGAVSATISGQDGRSLQIVVGVTPDSTCELLSWKAVSTWTEEGAGETLWAG